MYWHPSKSWLAHHYGESMLASIWFFKGVESLRAEEKPVWWCLELWWMMRALTNSSETWTAAAFYINIMLRLWKKDFIIWLYSIVILISIEKIKKKRIKKNNTTTKVKKFYCKYWKKYFSEQYEKKYSEKFKNNVIECHNSRMSTRDITKIFNISSSTILYWIKKNFLELKIHEIKLLKKHFLTILFNVMNYRLL